MSRRIVKDGNNNNNNQKSTEKTTSFLHNYVTKKLQSPVFLLSIVCLVVGLGMLGWRVYHYQQKQPIYNPPGPHGNNINIADRDALSRRFFKTPTADTIAPGIASVRNTGTTTINGGNGKLQIDQNDMPPELQKTHTFKPLSADADVADVIAPHVVKAQNGWYIHQLNDQAIADAKKVAAADNTGVTDEDLSDNDGNLVTRPITAIQPIAPERVALTADMILQRHPHDATCFTQGYAFFANELIESCGLYGQSKLRTVNYETGRSIRNSPPIPSRYFAEGLVITGDNKDNGIINLLTWQESTILRYKFNTFEQLPSLHLPTEGWGITQDGYNKDHVIVSDGSSVLYWYNINTMEQVRQLTITEYNSNNQKYYRQDKINELEWIPLSKTDLTKGLIWANVWYSNDIIIINPNNGQIVKRIDTTTLHPTKTNNEDVLNGIAYGYDNNNDLKLLFTGKKWKYTFEMDYKKLIPENIDYY